MKLNKMKNNTYSLEITSWENDGDNENTKYIHGLLESEAHRILALLKLFDNKKYNNLTNDGEEYTRLNEEFNKLDKELGTDYGYLEDFLDDIGMSSEDFIVRVLDNVRIYKLKGHITVIGGFQS